MKTRSMHSPHAGRCLAVGLLAALAVAMASPVLGGTVTWDAGGANENWNTAANWDPSDTLPGIGDNVLFDGSLAGVANSISLNASFQIQGLRVQEPLQNNWDVLNAGGGTLTLQDDNDNAVFIEYDSWRTSLGVGYHSRLYAPIVFNDPLTITKTGGGNELKIHTSLTGGANGVTFNGASLNDVILFFNGSSMSWSGTTTLERGTVGINSAASMQIGSAGLDVTTATVGDAKIQWRPTAGTALANDNDFILGTAGCSWFDMYRGVSSATTLTIEGDFTGGSTGVTLDFSVSQQSLATDTFILTGDINVDSQLRFLVGTGTPPNGTMRLNGTITKADGGVRIESGSKLDGSGTINFTLASATTAGPSNFGDLPIDLEGTLDISAMTADFTGSTVDGVSDYPLIAIDGAATLTGTFVTETAVPSGYEVQYTATEVKLVFVPGAPLSTDDSITIDEDTPKALSTDDFGTYDANGGDPLAEVMITELPLAGVLELSGVDVTLDQVISVADIDADNLIFTPTPDENGSPYATIGFKVGNGTEFSAAEYTLTVHVTPVNDLPTAADSTVETFMDTDYTFAAADFNFADVDEGDVLTKIQVTQLETVGALKLSGVDVTQDQEIDVAELVAGNLKYTPLAGQTGAPYDTFKFKVHDGTVYSALAYTMTVDVLEWVIADFNDSPEVLPGTIPTETDLNDGSPNGSWTIIQRGVTAPPDSGNGHTAIKSYSDAASDRYLEIDKSPTSGVAPEYDLAFDSTVPLDGAYIVSFDALLHRIGPASTSAEKYGLIVGYDASGDILFQVVLDGNTESTTYKGVGIVGQATSSQTINQLAYSSTAATTDMTTIGITLGATTFDVTVGGTVAYTGIAYDSAVTDLSRLKFTAMDPNKQFAGYSVDNIQVEVAAEAAFGTIFIFR